MSNGSREIDLQEKITAAKQALESYISQIRDADLRHACAVVVGDMRFWQGYGSAGHHHAYRGGLAIHTEEVARYAIGMAMMFPEADLDVVITSAIFHDYRKINEYDPTLPGEGKYDDGQPVTVGKTLYRKLVRHVAGSHAAFCTVMGSLGFPPETHIKIEHCILAHHGRREHGSPVEPQIVEAAILHYADMLSSQYGDGK